MNRDLMVILVCISITVILRILPFYLKSSRPLPKWFDDFLSYVPYTAIGALTIPGVINVTKDIRISATAFAVVLLISYKRGGMTIPIVSGVVTATILLYIL